MKPVEQRTVMRYFDGELSDEELADVEARLSSDAEATRLLADLHRLGRLVREDSLDRSRHVDLTDAVMARLEREITPPAASPSKMAVVTRARRLSAVVGVSVALAAAAAVVVVVRTPPSPRRAGEHVTSSVLAPRELPPSQPFAAASESPDETLAEAPAAAIEAVDFGAHAGSIFLVPEGDETTPVVWLVDEPTPSLGRMEPL